MEDHRENNDKQITKPIKEPILWQAEKDYGKKIIFKVCMNDSYLLYIFPLHFYLYFIMLWTQNSVLIPTKSRKNRPACPRDLFRYSLARVFHMGKNLIPFACIKNIVMFPLSEFFLSKYFKPFFNLIIITWNKYLYSPSCISFLLANLAISSTLKNNASLLAATAILTLFAVDVNMAYNWNMEYVEWPSVFNKSGSGTAKSVTLDSKSMGRAYVNPGIAKSSTKDQEFLRFVWKVLKDIQKVIAK